MTRTRIDFVGRRRTWAVISGLLILVSVLSLGIRQFELSIDFTGGSSFVLEGIDAPDVNAEQLRGVARDAGATGVQAQVKLDGDRPTGAIVQTEELEPGSEDEQRVRDALVQATGAERIDVNFVGPTWGDRISQKMLQGLVVFLIVAALYITFRLEAKMAGIAVVALVHDLLLTAGIYSLVGFAVSPSTVIALLLILGYSLYDTVVVFDRINENTTYLGDEGTRTFTEAVNRSMNEVLWRSINTSLTSLLPVGALLFVGSRLLGAETLQDLALALFIGMAAGTYSSLFLAGPLLATWKEREPEMQKLATKAARRDEAVAGAAAEGGTQTVPVDDRTGLPGYVRGQGRTPRRKRRR